MTEVQVVCRNCLARNRVPQSRLRDAPKCGKCHSSLFSGQLLELTDANFTKVLKASGQPLLVIFWAPWCGYCQKTLPEFKQACSELEPDYRLASLNTEVHRMTAGRYAVNGLPTMIMFNNGNETARQPGALSKAQIVALARSRFR